MVHMHQRLKSLQAMRALGAIAVTWFHSSSLAPGNMDWTLGAAGVDLFFIVSGIAMVISVREGTTAPQFLMRRAMRVVPLYWIATMSAYAFYAYRTGDLADPAHLFHSLLFLPATEKYTYPILYPGWSLNYEVFFYALLTISLAIYKQKTLWFAAILTAALGAISTRSGIYGIDYYLNPHLLEFSAGILIGYAIKNGAKIALHHGIACGIAAVAILATDPSGEDGNVAISWGIPCVLIVLFALSIENSSVIRSRITQKLGDASYSIYLVHAFPIWVCEMQPSSENGMALAIFAFSSSLALGFVVWKYVEDPILRWSTQLLNSRSRERMA